jgi:putative spermidine/putrescine transport system ATP-binding protein
VFERSGSSVTVESLCKDFVDEGVHALQDVTIHVESGEFVTLLGPSGSGKSTLLNIISGFVPATSGRVLLDSRSLADVPPWKRNIGVVFQHYALFPHMTVYGNVAFPLKRRGYPKREIARMVSEVLDLVQLRTHTKRYPYQLSGGEQQRIALARSLVFRPRLVLMDEPLGALDKRLRDELQFEIRRIHSELGVTFLHVTHDQEEAQVMSDRIVLLNKGRVEQIGTGEELYRRPTSLFVATFMGDSNILSGHVVQVSGGVALQADRIQVVASSQHATSGTAGKHGIALVRPEHVTLSEERPPSDVANNYLGQVIDVAYLGGARRVEVQLDGGPRVKAREQERTGRPPVTVGNRIWASWRPDDVVILREPQSAAGRASAADGSGDEDEHEVTLRFGSKHSWSDVRGHFGRSR